MRLRFFFTLAGLVSGVGLLGAGCGVTIGGRPLVGQDDSGAKPASKPADNDSVDWTGLWGSTFGVVDFTRKDGKVFGSYPNGTLECEAVKRDLRCKWADQTGSGRAKFHWDTTNKAGGTFGNGESDADQGEWTLTWPPPRCGSPERPNCVEGGGQPDGNFSVTLRNQCGSDVPICIETRSGGMMTTTKQSTVQKRSFENFDVKPGAKVWARSGGSCTTLLGTIQAGNSEFVVCK